MTKGSLRSGVRRPGRDAPTLPIVEIQRIVARYYGLEMREINGARRARRVSRPRQMAMALCREFTRRTTTQIAGGFGGRDHTTYLHACRAVDERLERCPETAAAFETLRQRVMVQIEQCELDTLAMRVYSAVISQAKWDDPGFVAVVPEVVPVPVSGPLPEISAADWATILQQGEGKRTARAYGPRPSMAELEQQRLREFNRGMPELHGADVPRRLESDIGENPFDPRCPVPSALE